MRIIRDLQNCPESARGAVIALGNFDGVHRGHQAIFSCCTEIAKGEHATPAALTFTPHPREFFARDKKPLRIYPFRTKAELLAEQGIDTLYAVRFNQKLASTPAKNFIEDILHRQLGVRHVVTGYNFAFGKGREGDTEFLTHEARRLGFGFTALPQVEDDGEQISSSAIRKALAEGDMTKASHMLGRNYTITGHIRRGEQRGAKLGFPTANMRINHLFLPRFGVYAATMIVDGKPYKAVANLGIKPTFGKHEPLLEVHIFDFNQPLYGIAVKAELRQFIRPEQTFSGVDALRTQIAEDAGTAKRLLAGEKR